MCFLASTILNFSKAPIYNRILTQMNSIFRERVLKEIFSFVQKISFHPEII